MKSLNSFLNPKRKKEIRFKLPAFEDEFVMRPLTLKEDLKLAEEYGDKSNTEMMIAYVANSLVTPDLRDNNFLEALSEREGRKILDPVDALKCIVNGAETASLIKVYNDFNEVTVKFSGKVDEAKN